MGSAQHEDGYIEEADVWAPVAVIFKAPRSGRRHRPSHTGLLRSHVAVSANNLSGSQADINIKSAD